jgi:hypothetical protein
MMMCLLNSHDDDSMMIVSKILEGLDQRLKNASSKHFSKGVSTRFERRNVERASKTHSESLVGPSEIFVNGSIKPVDVPCSFVTS